MTLLTPLNNVLRVPATDKDGRFEITGLGAERAVMVEMKSATAVMPILMIATREGFDPKLLKERGPKRRQPSCSVLLSMVLFCRPSPSKARCARRAAASPSSEQKSWAASG